MVDESIYKKRIKNVLYMLDKYNLDCILLNNSETISYLIGANNRCSWVFISKDSKIMALVLESDYKEYSKQSIVKDIRTFKTDDPLKLWKDAITEFELRDRSIALEKEHLRFRDYLTLKAIFGNIINLDFDADFIVEEARIIKEKDEIEKIKDASILALKVMNFTNSCIIKGESEINLMNKILNKIHYENENADALIYIGSDERSSLAHNPATNNKIKNGPAVVDLHLSLDGYHIDMARTFLLNDKQRYIYEFFKEKIHKYIEKCKDGQSIIELKNSFYKELKLGTDKEFKFLTGPFLHGVGIKNYELPTLDHPFEARGFIKNLKEGMVLALSNIGIYSENGWGIRYEETFLITKNKPSIFTLDNLYKTGSDTEC